MLINKHSRAAFSRRKLVGLLSLQPLLGGVALAQPTGGSVRIAQSTALSGPLGDLGTAIHTGAKLAFASINAQGGVHGRTIELIVADDAYNIERAVSNVDGFLSDPNLFALFNCMGTPAIAAMLPKVVKSGVPFFAPFTGAQFARPKGVRTIFNVRASYAEEAQKIVQHLTTLGIRKIVVARQDNAFGSEVMNGVQSAIERGQGALLPTVVVNADGTNFDQAIAEVASHRPEALVVGLAGQPAIDLIKAVRSELRGLSLYALSVVGAAGTITAMGTQGVGVTISQVVPSPYSPLPIAREFLASWKAAQISGDPSHLSLEGYINAHVFANALRRAGPSVSPRSFVDSTWSQKRHDIGGFESSFVEPGKGASSFVELTMVGRSGRLLR
ncbi:ABC transporter substrate-binding protein [Chitinimonas sp.]|uniref:ABC transporter substrate-binding protein n=1 Tax=Chitinimonas sp. TaxID=1934313 RepID=UPI0035B32615